MTNPAHPAARPMIAPSPTVPGDAALHIWQQVSDRHQDYLNATTAAHTAYLHAAAAILGAGSAQVSSVAYDAPRIAAPAPAPAIEAAPVPAPAKTNGAAGHAVAKPAAPPPAPAKVAAPAAAPVAASAAAPAPARPSADAAALVRSIVSEKTGYPVDMLDADMDLEGELGVDSIKQVEILSTLRERLPSLPEIDPERLVELRTIAAIAAMIEASGAISGSAPVAASVAAPASPAPAVHHTNGNGHANGNGSGVSAEIVRALIAEKTGYPMDMLEDDMDLEGELGVDSIKQVEILSSLRERYPSLPEVDPEYLSEMRTIRKIADFFA